MSLQWEGLAQFKADLRNLPEHLAEEAGPIVLAHAAEAERLIANVYPVRTTNLRPGPHRKTPFYPPGNLRGRVTTREAFANRFGAMAIVRSTAPHAWMYENGTKTRQHANGKNVGAMPQAPVAERMIPIAIQVRRRMVAALGTLLERAGFQLSQT